MTPGQRTALTKAKERLIEAFNDALKSMSEPGRARDWFIPYLIELLRVYRELREKKVEGQRLSKLLGNDLRARFGMLLKKSTNRDDRTRSRWAAALALAVKRKVPPKELKVWLAQGGGVAGRAAEYASESRSDREWGSSTTSSTVQRRFSSDLNV